MSGRCSLACRISGAAAAAGLSLMASACTSGADASRDLLAFEPGEAPRQATIASVGVESPVRRICDLPGGRALLDREIPGLTSRPEYPMFSAMSLVQLKRLSRGRITDQEVARVAAGLRNLTVGARAMRVATQAADPQPRGATTAPAAP